MSHILESRSSVWQETDLKAKPLSKGQVISNLLFTYGKVSWD